MCIRDRGGDFHQHVDQRAADFLAAGVGHYAEGAVLAAAFHHRDEGAGTIDCLLYTSRSTDLVALQSVEEGGLLRRLWDSIRLFFFGLFN